jgi:bifunctional NMN adenylyltransferase/nudix hydrolase
MTTRFSGAVSALVLICIGSAFDPRRPNYNPFTAQERERMIRDCLTAAENDRVRIEYIEDSAYNLNDWITSIQTAVADTLDHTSAAPERAEVVLIGHAKDNSSYYLKLFPQWGNIDVDNYLGLSATTFRSAYFEAEPEDLDLIMASSNFTNAVPAPVVSWLQAFRHTADYRDMVAEIAFTNKYREAWASAPYPPTFVTVDACVVQTGNILLIQRKARPGKGLWALPGGFLNGAERVIDGIFRELKEETSIKIPVPVLKGSMVGDPVVFDAPFRSSRGRTITHCALVHLAGATELPKIRAADDAADARWWPLSEVTRAMMFEDHYSIIKNMTARI